MGCAFGTSPMFSCEKRSWMCCMGNVYEFAEANPITMKFYDFEQGAACMICCASTVLSTHVSPVYACLAYAVKRLTCLLLRSGNSGAVGQERCADNQCCESGKVCSQHTPCVLPWQTVWMERVATNSAWRTLQGVTADQDQQTVADLE